MRKPLFPHALFIFVISLFFIFGQSIKAQSALDGFDPHANGKVYAIVVQPDGKIPVGGEFTNIGGQARIWFARLTNDTAALSTLNVSGTTVTLTRDGAAALFTRKVINSRRKSWRLTKNCRN
jgi:hypothetical protein